MKEEAEQEAARWRILKNSNVGGKKKKENLENEKLAAGKKRLQNRTQWSGGPVSVFLTAPNFCLAVCLRRGKSKVLVLTSQFTVGPQNFFYIFWVYICRKFTLQSKRRTFMHCTSVKSQ